MYSVDPNVDVFMFYRLSVISDTYRRPLDLYCPNGFARCCYGFLPVTGP